MVERAIARRFGGCRGFFAFWINADNCDGRVNPYKSIRGPQSGYNICNSTTAGDSSQCQTLSAFPAL